MEVWYKVDYYFGTVEPVYVLRSTKHNIYFSCGRYSKKISEGVCYVSTEKEAYEKLIDHYVNSQIKQREFELKRDLLRFEKIMNKNQFKLSDLGVSLESVTKVMDLYPHLLEED